MRILKATQETGDSSLVWHAMAEGDRALCGVRVPEAAPEPLAGGERYCPVCMNRVDTHVGTGAAAGEQLA
ncbi:hypothetical protein AB0J21_19575 [Streptomyces sp. NPDC049954]|uniref:hypothetical protein n=1 Tax=Streptomyces sp. NPDC049954 TaxID=3155779 RepID=UPI003427AAC3